MRTRALLLASISLLVLAVPLAPPAAAHEGPASCDRSDDPGYWSCSFVCHAGDRIQLAARTSGPNPAQEWPRLRAQCGGIDIFCQSNRGCSASSDYVKYDGVGRCFAETVYVNGTCSSVTTERSPLYAQHGTVHVPAQATPGVESESVDTPRANRVCAQNGLVCVGPAEAQHVADTPAVEESEPLTPPVAVRHEREQPVSLQPTTLPVERTVVAEGPVPVVVCDAGCKFVLPASVTGGASLAIEVFVGGERVAQAALP